MSEARRTGIERWGPVAVFALAGLLILAGVALRGQAPASPLFPLAQRALALHAEWTEGRLVLDPNAAGQAWPAFARSRAGVAGVPGVVFDAASPHLPYPWRGARPTKIEAVDAVVSGFGSAAEGALLLVAPASARTPLLGETAGHLDSEWARYDFDDSARRLMVWRRGICLFALVVPASVTFEEAGRWLPAPVEGSEGPAAWGAPGSADPTSTQ